MFVLSAYGVFACTASGQTYQLGADSSVSPGAKTSSAQTTNQQLGWGSNIQNARLARAAQLALQRGDPALAYEYSQHAAQSAPNDPQLWFLFGYAARLDAKYQQSIDAYKRGLSLNSFSLDGLSGLAQAYYQAGQAADAERILKQVTTADPQRKDDLILLGNIYLRARDYAGAIEVLLKAEKLQPNIRAEVMLALCYRQKKQLDLAERYIQLAKKRAPDDPDVERTLAGYYRDVGRYTDAIAALGAIRNPKPDVIAELAYTYQLDGKESDSARLYAQAADANHADIGLQLAAAQAEVAAGTTDSASVFLERSARLDGKNYRLHAIRAEIAELRGRDESAIAEYRDALANLPLSPVEGALYRIQLHMDLVALYKKTANESGARRELSEAQAEIKSVDGSGPDREKFLRLRGSIKLNAGDTKGALADIDDALAINSESRDDLQLRGDILMKMGRAEDALAAYKKVLAEEPSNKFALTSAGYASRAAGHDDEAERYFQHLAQVDPASSAPYLALGDLYTSRRAFKDAQASYSKGHSIDPRNALVVAGGINAAIEAHNIPLAGQWVNRITASMLKEPQILREKERFLSFDEKYEESAAVGEQAIKVLPTDRDVVVYLGYDLLHLGRYDELLGLTEKYYDILPHEADIPLLEGYVYKHEGRKEKARQDFTEALARDPNVATAYVNRGYVLNDLHEPQLAEADFESAIAREPHNGEAHLGLAYASLDLKKPHIALQQADLAEEIMGDSRDVHVIRAAAYAHEDLLVKAAAEYQRALKFSPNDNALHLAFGNTLLAERKYRDAINEGEIAQKLAPNDPNAYVLLARASAIAQQRDRALQYAQLAVEHLQSSSPKERSDVFVSVGEAMSTVGDQKAAMVQFRKALEVHGGDRVGVRLAIAQMMAHDNQTADAERQIALAWMEAAAGETGQPSSGEYIAAADVFRAAHDYRLSENYLHRAKLAGAPDVEVRIGLANNDLAIGNTARAQAELSAAKTAANGAPDYQYLLAEANLFRQEHEDVRALTAFAQASNAAGDDQTVEQSMLQAGADEGLRITPNVSLLADASVEPIFEDTTVYVLDSKLDTTLPVPSSNSALLPPPRSSIQTQSTEAYHLHVGNFPTISGFVQLRNAQGQISVPATNSIVSRNTTDYALNTGVNPVLHLGNNVLVFNAGVQATLRRDSLSPIQMNQNLFRTFAYVSSSSFFNVISFSGYFIHETGPFTESNLRSRAITGALDFRVGAPWGTTALITGWGMNDQLFSPIHFEDYNTSAYVGIEHKFSERLNIRAIAEDVRAWRMVGANSGIAQNLRPAASIDFSPKRNWDIQVASAYSNNRAFHVYDALQNGFSISYAKPFHRKFNGELGPVDLKYPIRFSAGVQQESFMNFDGTHSQQFRPYVEISIF